MTPLRSKILIDIFGILVVAIFIALMPGLASDPGVGWHLKTGEWIATYGAVPYADPFLSTSGAKLWVSNQWLADLFLFWGYQAGGWGLLSGMVLALGIAGYLIWLPRNLLSSTEVNTTAHGVAHAVSAPVWFIGLLLITLLGALQWFIRPVIFSFLFFIIVFGQLRQIKLPKRDLVLLPLLFIVWANIHSAFPLGLIAIALSCATASDKFHRASLLLLCSLATVVNPYGLDLHRNIIGLLGEPYFMSLNTEWLAPDFRSELFLPLLIAILLLLSGFALGLRLSLFELASLLVFLALALRGRRYIPFFAVVAAAPILLSLQLAVNRLFEPLRQHLWSQAFLEPGKDWKWSGIPTAIACLILIGVFSFSGKVSGPEKVRPKEAIDAIEAVHSSGAIFHSPDIGGYITYRLWPRQRAWIDDRNELNGKALYEEYFQVTKLRPQWEEVLRRYNFEFIVIDSPSPIATMLKTLHQWAILFEDSKTIVFRKQ